jgi:multiple sugar transport system permease protein
MYEEGFRWWNLGIASAVAFVLFVIIVVITRVLLLATRAEGRT